MASLIDNPDAFFNEILSESSSEPAKKKEVSEQPQKVEPTLVPITEAGPLAEPKPEAQAPTNESPEKVQREVPSLVSNPDAFFKSIGESENTANPEEPKYDSADYLAAATKDLDSEAVVNKYGEAINSMSPESISKFQKMRPDLILPRDVWAKGYAAEKSKPMQILPTKKELGEMIYSKSPEGEIGGLAGTLKKLALGAKDIAVDVFDTDPASNQRLATDVKSFVAPVMGLPEEVIWTGTKMAQGGTQITDWALGRSDEEKEENAYQRHIVDAAREQARKASRNNIYERLLTSPTMVTFNKAILSTSGPSVSDIMAAYPEMSKEEAAAYRENTLNQQALELAKENAASQLPLNANVEELGTWFTPGGLGMGEFGLLMNAPRIAKGLGKLAESKLLTKAEIGAKRAAEFETAEVKIASDIEKAQKPSLAGVTADTILRARENLSKFAEANPKLARLGEVALEYAPAGVLGYEATGSSPGGALAGLASVAIGKKIGLGKVLEAAPQLVSDIDKARRIAAGGKVGMYEMAGALPESSAVTRALFGGGRGAFTDKFANAAADYVAEGVNVSALGLATGLINSEDTEALRQSMATGLMYGLGFKTIHKVLGKDAVADERRQKQEDVDNRMTLEAMDPNSRNNVLAGTEWNNVVEKSKRQMDVAQTEYEMAKNSGDAAAAKEAADRLRMLQAVHERNVTASVQTRQAYGREVLKTLTAGQELLNGTMRAGQKNAGISVLTTRQIYDQLKSRPENAGKTDAQLEWIAQNADGIYFNNEGTQVTDRKKAGAQEGGFENVVFDPFKPTVVVNADKVKERMGALGKSYHEALTHEIGHALNAVPEFKEANKSAEESLFGIERRDLNGNVETFKPGVFSTAKLVELFQTEYLGKKGYTPEQIIDWARNNGMWDETNKRLREEVIAPYMKEEIMAGLTGINLMPDVKETGIRHMLDWASIQAQNNIVARAINKTIGYGGKLPHEMLKDENSGVTFTPQQLASNKEALKQIRKLNGMLSSPISDGKSAPSISKMELLANKGLWKRYAQDSGLFKTEIRATIYDANGAAIGSELVADVNAKEGSWSSTPEGVKKDSGYGDLPAGVEVPEGGSVRITRELVMGPDGQTPQMLSPKEAKDLQTARTGLIRDALINAYEGEEGGFRATSEDGLSFRGTFTAKQMQALRDLPESIVPKSVKDVILRMNTLVAEKAGQRVFIDYAAMMNDNGRYKAFAPKIYEIVPLSMGLSKEGNFYVVSASVTRLNEKLKAWQERLPGRLSLWNGNAEAFFSDFANIYLKNWQEGRPGDSGLDADPKIAMQKKTIFADYLNFATKDTAELHDQTTIPRKRGDARDKNLDRIIMSVRADHVRDMLESTNIPLPIDYLKGKYNLMPARKDVAEEGGLGYKESPTNEYREPKYETTNPPRLGFRNPRNSEEGQRVLGESPILATAFDALDRAEAASGDQSQTSGSGLKPLQEEALRKFAQESGVMETPENVSKWGEDWAYEGRDAGTEHQTLLGSGERISKRSDAPWHNWRGYLERILLHNMVFPETAPKLEKFHDVDYRQEDINGKKWEPGLYVETSQPFIDGRHADPAKEIKPYMESLGFVSDGPMNYYNPETGIHVKDLHPGNASVVKDANGNWDVKIFDPMIHLTGTEPGDAQVRARVEAKLAAEGPQELGAAIDRAESVLSRPENMPTQFKPAAKNSGNTEENYPTNEKGFYSGLQKTIDEKMPAKASPQQILSIVNNPQNAKADEVKWSNLSGYLEGKTSVTKQEVLDYLRNEGSVKFEERTLGEPSEEDIQTLLADEMGEGMDRQDAIDYLSREDGGTKYSQYVLPNGENYREVVLTMPSQEIPLDKYTADLLETVDGVGEYQISLGDRFVGNPVMAKTPEDAIKKAVGRQKPKSEYTSSHFTDIPNYVAHMRLNERPDAEGRKGLFIEEIQSDRHQQGREKGYDVPTPLEEIESRLAKKYGQNWKIESTKDEKKQYLEAFADNAKRGQIPDAPFRKDWSVQMFKRALRDAIEGDMEWIGWTKGIDQVKRYENSIRQSVDEIRWEKSSDGTMLINAIKGGRSTFAGRVGADGKFVDHPEAKGKSLDEVIGKGMTEKIVDGGETGVLKGNDLTIGGEGMKGFYDSILPNKIGKYIEKWGAKVEEGGVAKGDTAEEWAQKVYGKDAKLEPWMLDKFKGEITPIWKVAITPEMRSSIKEGGQIAFMPARKGDSPASSLSKDERDTAVKFLERGTLTAANVFDALAKLANGDMQSITEKLSTGRLFELAHRATGTPILNRVDAISAIRKEINSRKDAMPQSSMASPMADDIIRTPVNRQAAQGLAFKPSKKIDGAEEIEIAPGFQKAPTKSGKWSVYNPENHLATGKQFDSPEAADEAAKVIANANEPLQGIPYSLQEGRTGKWKIIDKKGEAAASKTFSDPTEAAEYAVALHRELLPLAAVKKFMLKADRDAVTEAEQRIADMQAKNPEAMPLVVARDGDTGLPKIDLLEDAEGNPVLDEKGKQARGVIYRQVPYKLRQSPMLDAKDDNVAVQQAADLMTPEVQIAMADPSVAKAIGWYKQMRKQLQQYYGANIELFGQLLGATSARTPVDENFKQTIEAARQYSKGAYDTLLQEFHEHIVKATEDLASGALQERWEKKNPTKTWNQEKDGTDALRMEINKFSDVPLRSNGKKFNANSQKVLHALYGNWLSQTVGPKTPNFAGNLTGRTLRATIDVWAARNLRRLLYDDGTSQWRLLPEQEKGVDSAYNAKGELTGDFPFAQNVYDVVADRVNMNADDLQALMWFYEKGIWDQNGWTGALGAKKSSFEEEAEKLSLDRYQAGVTAYTNEGDYPNLEEFNSGVQEKTRKELRDSIGQLSGVEISRVTHTDGLYGGSVEPSLDVEFSVSRDKNGKPQSIASVIDRLKAIGKEQNQYDTFISQLVDKEHPNARPMVEVGFKNAAKPEEVDAVVKAFRDAGIDGFTLAKDSKGNVIGIRAQYIPEISSRWDEEGRTDLLDPEKHGESSQSWADKARQAVNSLGDQENVSYKNEGYVSTHVYGKEEYDAETSPQDLLGSDVRDQLGRRKRILEAPAGEGQVSSGIGSD
jgi:hypothetical protein